MSGENAITVECAYAKVNLCLDITGLRADGYHLLDMINVEIGLHDRMQIRKTTQPGIELGCDKPGVPLGPENLIVRAFHAFKDECQLGDLGLRVQLEKAIPAGGGLGGGSMDAAALLRTMDREWPGLDTERLTGLAVTIGADVPYGIRGGAARITGVGEGVELLLPQNPLPSGSPWLFLIMPPIHSDTRGAYRAWDAQTGNAIAQLDGSLSERSAAVADLVRGRDFEHLENYLFNVLQKPVFRAIPELRELHSKAEVLLNRPVHMTGSGSNLFVFCQSEKEAAEISDLWKCRMSEVSADAFPILI